jgi:HipA-like protein
MIKAANVYSNNELVGSITKEKSMYSFTYTDEYYNNSSKKAISISFPKTKKEFQSPILFPFFFNMLSEGANRHLQCRLLKIDENDYFGLLLATANSETIGAITVKPQEIHE